MDDLNGLEWSNSSGTTSKAIPKGLGNYYVSVTPPFTSSTGTSTPTISNIPASARSATPISVPKSSTPDSFSNLVSFPSIKQNVLSLQEQQARLAEEKARQAEERRRQYESQFDYGALLKSLDKDQRSLHTASAPPQISPSFHAPTNTSITPIFSDPRQIVGDDEDEDLFAAFNKNTRVDSSSHYPPPQPSTIPQISSSDSRYLNLTDPQAWNSRIPVSGDQDLDDGVNDPFGLGRVDKKSDKTVVDLLPAQHDDDFLGDLGKPVNEINRQPSKPTVALARTALNGRDREGTSDPWDKAIGELVDMGFSKEDSQRALSEGGEALDIQVAVSWLLNDAHRQSKQKAKIGHAKAAKREAENGSRSHQRPGRPSVEQAEPEPVPAWMIADRRNGSNSKRDDSRSPAGAETDVAKTAVAVGNNLLKTANSLWKTSQKKVQKAVSDFQSESDASQPKWMRSGHVQENQGSAPGIRPAEESGGSRIATNATVTVTDEALLLEADSRPTPRRTRPPEVRHNSHVQDMSRSQGPIISAPSTDRSTPAPRRQQDVQHSHLDPKSRLSKQAVEEQTSQAYVSPSRRRKVIPTITPTASSDLLFDVTASQSPNAISGQRPQSIQRPRTSSTTKNVPIKSNAVSKQIPEVSRHSARRIPDLPATALASSTQHRLAGTEHFKRGDYAAAFSSYSIALDALPQGHPITIVLLCNRSLTALKTGEPKSAVSDANTALALIGAGKGENETIDLQNNTKGEGKKDMREFWGKALTRKAEALEQMERWSDAYIIWKQAVEASIGGTTAAQGRQRCESALQPKKQISVRPAPKSTVRVKPSAFGDLTPDSVQSTAAVKRLREANAAAEKADDEKFALADSVDARLLKWREGRKDNLRALLGGMDQVLWAGSGWKKIGMHELVVNSKVKINYMKAIAKVHPDKLPQDASTEVQMISAAVFATLNEAWDKFKTENGM